VIRLADGYIVSAGTEEEHSNGQITSKLEDILKARDYQTITVTEHNGVVVRAVRETPITCCPRPVTPPPRP